VVGDAVNATVGTWLADRLRHQATAACSQLTARRCAARPATATRCTSWQRWTTRTGPCSPSVTCPATNEIAVFAPLLTGHLNLAAVLRHTDRDPARPLILGLAYA
jgi:hypothetical protein